MEMSMRNEDRVRVSVVSLSDVTGDNTYVLSWTVLVLFPSNWLAFTYSYYPGGKTGKIQVIKLTKLTMINTRILIRLPRRI